jgi:uncharacterized protein with gpF-like domain
MLILDYKQQEALRKRKARKLKRIKDPVQAERNFRLRLGNLWTTVLLPATQRIQTMVRDKATPAELAEFIESVIERADMQYDIQSQDIIWRWQSAMDRDTRAGLMQGLKEALGVDINAILDAPEIRDALSVGAMEAVNLIKSIPQKYLGDVTKAITDNFTGKPLPEGRTLLQQIQKIGQVTEKRAKLIARDQTKKMSANLNRVRQESIGIDTYIWRTAKDERVAGNPKAPNTNDAHGNHYAMEGVYCRWDDPTVYSTDKGKTWKQRKSEMPKAHPGVEILCRCSSEAVIDIDKILANVRES